MDFKHAYKDAKRIKQIVSVLFKVGLGYYIDNLRLSHHLFMHQRVQIDEKPKDLPRKLRMAMDELGGTFVKLGQLLSLRPDLIPDEYCEEFEHLQDDVTPISYEIVKKIIETELKSSLNQIFSYLGNLDTASFFLSKQYLNALLHQFHTLLL